jgi:branched-chain amino acid transport system ATP-binding protein
VSAVLELRDLAVAYGGVLAVRGVSLSVEAGSIATVIGANGAGKSTLLNAIMGILPSQGHIGFSGASLEGLPVEARVAAGLGLVPERRELFSSMSVDDNLRLGAFLRRDEGRSAIAASLDEVFGVFPRLRERQRQLAGTLSGGERQMLAMGRALMGRPKLLMLDEPSLGLAPLIVRDIFEIIGSLKRAHVAILLVEQNARAALRIADQGYVMENGTIVLEGSCDALRCDPRVAETYLGIAHAPS